MSRMATVAVLLLLAAGAEAQEKGEKQTATDPAKAGPDWQIQGEYVGPAPGDTKLGAEVVALGGGKFAVNVLPGGLRGAGGVYQKRLDGTAERADDKVTVTGKDGKWNATIDEGVLAGQTPDGVAFRLQKTIRKSKTLGAKPPAGAVVLFDGKDASEWNNGHMVGDSLLGSDVASKKKFGDHHLHLEFRLSFMPEARGQGRSNSGVYVQHRYEVQVLDSFGLKGENNECGGIYSQQAPKVNMCYPPLTWQTYDIDFQAARFDKDGKKTMDAVITVHHNGVLIHDHVKLRGPTPGGGKESSEPGPVFLQGHGGQVEYQNIWVTETNAGNPPLFGD